MTLFGGLFDKEGMVKATIETCLETISAELGCKLTELFIMIKPTRDEFSEDEKEINVKFWIYKIEEGKPKLVREISLSEILGDEDE